MEKIEKLKQLLILTQNDTLTPKEVEKFLTMVLEVIKKSKDNFEKLSADNLQTLASSIAYVEELTGNVSNDLSSKSSALLGQIESKIDLLNTTLKEVKAMKLIPGKKGKDADEKKIIKEVLSQIELPKFKETILDDASQIKDKLETLEGDNRLDIKAIKGAEKLSTQANLDRAISVLDKRTQFLINKPAGSSSPLTTKGDLYTYDTDNARLGVGADGQVLVADSTETTGLKWINSSGIVNTLANTSADSTTTASSLYQMTSGVNVDFQTSGAVSRLKLFESGGVEINSTDTIISGFSDGLNIKGANPTFRLTDTSVGGNGKGAFISGDIQYNVYTNNNWAGITSAGTQRYNRWGFGGNFQIDAIVHAKPTTATDIVSIFQGTTSQSGNLTEWQDVNGNILSRVDSSGNVILGNNKYLKWRNNANNADVNVFLMDTNDDLQALGTWQFINGLKTDTLTNRSGAMTIGTTNAVDVILQTDSLARLTIDGSTGYVGIGTTGPSSPLQINKGTGVSQFGAGSSGSDIILSSGGAVYTSAIWSSIFGPRGSGEAFSWSDWDGNPLMTLITATGATKGNFGIGTTSPSARLHTKATTATDTVMIAQGTTSQTGNLTEWRDVSNTVLASVSSNGRGAFNDIQVGVSGINISGVGGNGFNVSGGGFMIFKSSGVLTLSDTTDNNWDRLQFGGSTSSFPALKRNGAGLDIRLADDSAYADITANKVTSIQSINTANAITASSNSATIPITHRNNKVTNDSAATLTITLTTSGAVDMQTCTVQIIDFSAVAQTITWVNTEDSTATAPVTSNGSTTLPLTVGFIYNSATSKWRCVASA